MPPSLAVLWYKYEQAVHLHPVLAHNLSRTRETSTSFPTCPTARYFPPFYFASSTRDRADRRQSASTTRTIHRRILTVKTASSESNFACYAVAVGTSTDLVTLKDHRAGYQPEVMDRVDHLPANWTASVSFSIPAVYLDVRLT
jgi:hypothetical protein